MRHCPGRSTNSAGEIVAALHYMTSWRRVRMNFFLNTFDIVLLSIYCPERDAYFAWDCILLLLSDCTLQGSGIFVKWREGLWCRATIVELLARGCAESVTACSVKLLANIKVFFIDDGPTKSISIQRYAQLHMEVYHK